MEKQVARNKALSLRRELNIHLLSEKAIEEIVSLKLIEDHQRIGIYYPLQNEINLMGLVDCYPQKEFFLPAIDEQLCFRQYLGMECLVPGPFKTKESTGPVIEKNQLDCIFVPCVAISRTHQRVGYGKGYYDRYLEGYDKPKIGVCPKACCDMDVRMSSHDIVLDKIIQGSEHND